MANVSKILLPGMLEAGTVRDNASLHFRGHFDYGLTAGANHTYTGTPTTAESGGTDLTDIRVNDFITYGAENLNIVCTDISSATSAVITWTSTSESTAENALSNVSINDVDGVVTDHVAAVIIYPKDVVKISDDASTATTNNTLPAGILTAAPTADLELANKKYVDDSTTLAGHMKFKGTVGTGGDVTTLPLTTSTAKVGDTYKVYVDGTYTIDSASSDPATQAAKVGDLFICKVSSTTATPAVVYTYVPSGDDVDVTAIAVGTGMTVEDDTTHSTTSLTTTGTIGLALASGTALTGSATAATTEDRIFPLAVDASANLAVAISAGALDDVLADSDTTSAVTALSTASTTTGSDGAVLAAHMGVAADGEDTETLYFDYIVPTMDDTIVSYDPS